MNKHRTTGLLGMGVFIATLAFGGELGITYNWTIEPGESAFPMEWNSTTFASESNRVWVGENEWYKVYDRTNNLLQTVHYDNSITWPIRILMDDENLYILYRGQYGSGNNERGLRVFRKSDLSVIWSLDKWNGLSNDFYYPEAMAMDDQYLYVANTGDSRDGAKHNIYVIDKITGSTVRSWGGLGSLPEQFNQPYDVAVSENLLYVADRLNAQVKIFTKSGSFIRSIPVPSPWSVSVIGDFVYVGASDGLRIYDKNDNLLWRSSPEDALSTVKAYQDQGRILLLKLYNRSNDPYRFHWLTGPIYRTLGEADFNQPPVPVVSNLEQRQGIGVLDIDYTIHDEDDSVSTVYPLAFQVPDSGTFTPNLTNCIPMRTFIEGTDTNTGSNILVGTSHRLSWDMMADGIQGKIPDFGNIKVAVMAKDQREGMLDLHFLQIPILNGNPALTINRVPLQDADFLPVWLWLIASNDGAVDLTTNGVVAAGGFYDGQMLATGTNTTSNGRSFLFERMNVREATAQEIQQAKEAGTPGTVQQWPALRTPPDRDAKVNAIGFVTEPTNGWWVVPLP
ncbi:hypothetical protein P4B35_01355 [Pontiellaceae bacterium B12227]|nr:hypothetical protein [Pontiellaceae bacterium B12227]